MLYLNRELLTHVIVDICAFRQLIRLQVVARGLVLWFGGVRVMSNTLSVGELVAFITYLNFLVQPLPFPQRCFQLGSGPALRSGVCRLGLGLAVVLIFTERMWLGWNADGKEPVVPSAPPATTRSLF